MSPRIRTRLMLMNGGLLLATLLALGSASWWYQREMVLQSLSQQADTLAQAVSRTVAFPLAVQDYEGLNRQIDSFARSPDLVLVEVLDVQGTVVARAAGRGGQGELSFECVHPVDLGGLDGGGRVRLVVSSRAAMTTLSRFQRMLVAVTTLLLVMGLGIAYVLGGRLATPLERLTAAAEELGQGDLGSAHTDVAMQLVPASAPGEIGRLAQVFGHMAAALGRQADLIRRASERELVRARTDWDVTFDAIADAIAVFDADGRLVRSNLAFRTWAERDDSEGSWIRGLAGARAESAQPSEDLTVGATHFLVREFPLPHGEDRSGRVLILRDVTERARLREQLAQSERLSALGLLSSGVAHELNNPLAGVLGFVELALRQDISEAARRHISRIPPLTERMRKIIHGLLAFARPHPPERTPVALNRLIEETLELRSFDQATHGITVQTSLDPALPDFAGDPHRLQQVLLNLVINAEQAVKGDRERGTIRIATRLLADEHVELVVEDDGPGIAPGALARIFDPFFTTKEPGIGTGLGLSVVHGIVRDHGGTILAENRAAAGARFRVVLPLLPADRAADERATGGRGAGRLVLVIDDEPSLLEIVSDFLVAAEYRVVTASTVEAALDLARRFPIDVILTDVRMPGGGGRALTDLLRDALPGSRVPIMYMSGDAYNAEGLDPVLQKPFSAGELLAALATV